jgi:predicted phosphodiesterase
MTRKRKTIKRTVVISDLQVPYHDPQAVRNVAKFIRKWRPDKVVTVGDEIDLPQLSRWERGLAGEFAGTLDADRRKTQEVLFDLGVTDMVRSNHTDRLYNSIKTRLPAFADLPELQFENWLGLRDLGIKFHRNPFPIAKGWIVLHGDEGQVSQKGGQTALGLAIKHGKSVVCGHTHRAGLSGLTMASGGVLGGILWGLEVGNLMNFKDAKYLKGGSGNWQQGFGLIYERKGQVTPVFVPIERDGSFTVEGKVYG